MLEKNGDVITQVVPDRTSATLLGQIRDHVELDTEIHTDEHGVYRPLAKDKEYDHRTVDHSKEEWVDDTRQTVN